MKEEKQDGDNEIDVIKILDSVDKNLDLIREKLDGIKKDVSKIGGMMSSTES